jgi:phosphate transport system substrate-binding protein
MKSLTIALLLLVLSLVVGETAFAQMKLNGAGATFPYVIYSKWFDVYSKKSGVEFNYQSIGSGGGIKQSYKRLRENREQTFFIFRL